MSLILSIWVALGTIAAVIWLARNFLLTTALRNREHLGVKMEVSREKIENADHKGILTSNVSLESSPLVSVLVAARDEEANIETCVRGLFAQEYPNFELIAIDDRSRDGTPAILARLQNEFGERLRVLTIRILPEGWFGKNNAMHEGVEVSTGEWLLFTDADCRFTSPQAISAAMHEATSKSSEFLSVIPKLEARETWERILQPVCCLVLMFWFQPHRVNNPRSRDAYANGAFMLIHRRCYDSIGGHGAVRTELNEDIHLARAAKRLGARLRVVENNDHFETRMYPAFGAALRGWSRIFAGSLSSFSRVAIAAALIAVSSVFPWIGLWIGIIGRLTVVDSSRQQLWMMSAAAWGIAAVLMQLCLWRLYAALGFGRRWSLFYSPGALIVFGIMMSALSKVAGATNTTWRGTAYRAGRQPATTGEDRG